MKIVRKNRMVYWGVIPAGALLFWFMFSLPMSRRFTAVTQKISRAEEQIADINRLIGSRKLGEVVGQLSAHLRDAENLIAPSEEAVINRLSEAARKLKIDIKNLSILSRQDVTADVFDSPIEELPLSFSLSGEYRALVEFLEGVT
ncbi:MAG: hypothetical protein KKC84_07365, partial [Candidatus Omnitrophica bacterium]|nr:hypothetical protein [Candidatus Omnitrophota bacterium]